MASLSKAINQVLFESVLPTFGNPRNQSYIWDEGQKMFICNEYESANGNRYYKGIRFCNRIVMVEKVGLFQTWTYLDGLELYAFNGKCLELIQKRDYDKQFRSEIFVKKQAAQMLVNYLTGVSKIRKTSLSVEQAKEEAESLVGSCYKSFLDNDYSTHTLTQIILQIANH